MHVNKNRDGSFTLHDEPLRVAGPAADKILTEIERTGRNEEREQILRECEREYRAAEEKRVK